MNSTKIVYNLRNAPLAFIFKYIRNGSWLGRVYCLSAWYRACFGLFEARPLCKAQDRKVTCHMNFTEPPGADCWGRVWRPICMLAAIWDAHIKDLGKAACGSSSWSPTQNMVLDMKFTDLLGAISGALGVIKIWNDSDLLVKSISRALCALKACV